MKKLNANITAVLSTVNVSQTGAISRRRISTPAIAAISEPAAQYWIPGVRRLVADINKSTQPIKPVNKLAINRKVLGL
ncbi:hypothetical protein N5D37_09540 [Comamonas aquatica]|uniref:hypothetical protein n=1 Tax=Comamonas aquatica TaxID=225991 RepID=UPI002449406D|nr:hypothetical protein [Comamonas aquatica]MDH1765913.1 hypothetical protein [Comamonas aquatica]